jgi:hypothetical protein
MDRFKPRQIITAFLVLLVVAIAIAALVSVGRSIFSSDTTMTSQISTSHETLISTSADRAVQMTVRGPIVANEDFRTYQVQVTPNERNLITYTGHQGQPANSIVLVNNIPAYEQFVYALDRANLMRGTEFTGDKNDLRGICATGYLYEFRLLKANESQKQLWTSSCSGARGSLSASLDPIKKLFIAQIPNAQKTINALW